MRLTGDAMCVEALSPPFVHTTDFVCDPRTVHTNGSSAGRHTHTQSDARPCSGVTRNVIGQCLMHVVTRVVTRHDAARVGESNAPLHARWQRMVGTLTIDNQGHTGGPGSLGPSDGALR